MRKDSRNEKWTSCVILSCNLEDVKKICENKKSGFANPTQFINFIIRKELDRRKIKN